MLKELITKYKQLNNQIAEIENQKLEIEENIKLKLAKYPTKTFETIDGDKVTLFEKKMPITEKYLKDNFDANTLSKYKVIVQKESLDIEQDTKDLGLTPETRKMLKVTIK
jgi:hypothetical protein